MLRTTVIAKTDLVKSTQHIRRLTAPELESLLASHTSLFTAVVEEHQGAVLKGEGDAFWLTFPSVTSAALAAIDMQHSLRHAQLNVPETERLAMRVVIALGDLLMRNDDLFGPAMALTARIEGVTPANEIYLAHAAWLALNHAQIETALVDTFTLKGFDQPESVYRVLQRDVVHVENDQFIVTSDLMHFTRFVAERSLDEVAALLAKYEELAITHLTPFGGKLRVMAGDTFITTFALAPESMAGSEAWVQAWLAFIDRAEYDLPIRVGVEKGSYYMFRTHLFGNAINNAVRLAQLGSELNPTDRGVIVVSKDVQAALQDTAYGLRLRTVSMPLSDRFKRMPNQIEPYQLMI